MNKNRSPVVREIPTIRLTYTVKEAAHRLGISLSCAYEAIERNEIPSLKIGRRKLIPRIAFEKMLETAQTRLNHHE